MSLSRRSMLRMSGAAAAGALASGALSSRAAAAVRTRVLIVGSGPGGSAAADRLTAAGVECTVIERGRRWQPGDFPPALRPDPRTLWLDETSDVAGAADTLAGLGIPGLSGVLSLVSALPGGRALSTGLIDVVASATVQTLCGAGVGGSSLVYGAVLPQPAEDALARILPDVDYGELNDVYYPRARQGIGASPIPDDVLAHPAYAGQRAFAAAASRAGVSAERVDLGIDWDAVRRELADPAGPTGASTGDYILTGTNSGAKISVDRSYLARAEATGRCTVLPLHQLTGLAAAPGGGYTATVDTLDETGARTGTVQITADAVVLAAGAAHTPGILVRARDTGALPALSGEAGRGWGTNADQIGAAPLNTTPGGPPPFIAVDGTSEHATIEPFALGAHAGPLTAGTVLTLGMGVTSGTGTWTLGPAGQPVLTWSPADDVPAQTATRALAARLAASGAPQAVAAFPPTPVVTGHPLGGAVLGRATDGYGRLEGYRGLYCLDGSLIPGSAGGVNPTLTITALVERCLDDIVRRDFAAL